MKTLLLGLIPIATALRLFAAPDEPAGYVAHEWGTFTSVQGADGRQLEWNPLTVSELPGFVYDVLETRKQRRPGGPNVFLAKTAFSTLQRMETPVIYFYADQPQTVNVDVRFPQGLVTEWYPEARPLPKRVGTGAVPKRDHIAWDSVRVLAKADATPLPGDTSGSHYFAARGAEANRLQVTTTDGKTETEKFLFYRGVGNFRTPLTVTTVDDARELTLKNEGPEALGPLFVFQLRDGRGAFQRLDPLPSGEVRPVRLTSERQFLDLAELRKQVGTSLKEALVAEGLFPAEAAAMVATWDDSWFAESGVRVLYTLPTAWTDRILPLKLTPAPRAVARVFVGRAEVITPPMEFSLLRQMLRYSDGDEVARNEAVKSVRALALGRFAEPAVRRVLAVVPPNREFSNRAWELLENVSKPEPKPAQASVSPWLPDVLRASSLTPAFDAALSCSVQIPANGN